MDHKVTVVTLRFNQDEAKSHQTTTAPKEKGCIGLPVLHPERLKMAKALVEKAVKMHKIFSVQGPYPVIRETLRARGWVEQRMHRPNKQRLQHHRDSCTDAGDSDDEDGDSEQDEAATFRHFAYVRVTPPVETTSFYLGNSYEVKKEPDPDGMYGHMSRLVRNEKVYFYWTNRRDAINTNSLQKEQITNHFAKAGTLTTKVGLCVNLRKLKWFDAADADTFFPRCYRLSAQEEKQAFIEDYRRTACTGLLKYITKREEDEGTSPYVPSIHNKRKLSKSRPVVLSQMIDRALKVCQEFLESLEHKDIDISLETSQTLTEEDWTEFINNYYLVVHDGAEVDNSDHFGKRCKAMLQKLGKVCPQLDIDGMHNIWIIKPGAKSRGRGIKCVKRLDQILMLVNSDPSLIKESKWVVQKYVESPLLVHGTKFDVRQWFLVTDWQPLTVWFYKKCYLRFSTQPFSLDTLDRSVHLCNNSVQRRLRPSQQRHQGIPADNMWPDEQFRVYLSSQGREAQWESVVVPGMKKAVIHALQTTQDLIESRKNTFELYGADFVLGRDLRPWLIEINASPTMAPSTTVTARLCTAVQKDTLRVVLDWRPDRYTDTGDFELIFKQAAVEVPHYTGVNLLVEGLKIKQPPKHPAPKRRRPVKNHAAEKVKPKALLKTADTTAAKHNNIKVLQQLPLPPDPPVADPFRTVHLSTRAQPHSVFLGKKKKKFQMST